MLPALALHEVCTLNHLAVLLSSDLPVKELSICWIYNILEFNAFVPNSF